MFRKPKSNKNNKAVLRRKIEDTMSQENSSEEEGNEDETSELLSQARKRSKTIGSTSLNSGLVAATSTTLSADDGKNKASSSVLHTFASSHDQAKPSEKDLATSTATHHASAKASDQEGSTGFGEDGIFRDSKRNKFHAGPIRAPQNVRVTARFDYQPDICKDYKQTGFCGFGDTCIYLHDRSDTLSGWQLEQQWQQQQDAKKKQQESELDNYLKQQEMFANGVKEDLQTMETDSGLPFACHICRTHFTEPVVTNCMHYFCQDCILKHVRETAETCPICGKDTFGVFNEPSKLIAYKRKVLGRASGNGKDSWKAFFDHFHKSDE
jgi:RING finger protein 113A